MNKKGYVLLKRIIDLCGSEIVSCMECGTCTSVCHAASKATGMGPERLVWMVNMGLDEEALNTPWIWSCSMCGRCIHHCPMEIDIPSLVYALRRWQGGKFAPDEIREFSEKAKTSGNVLSITPFEAIKTLKWIEHELRRTVGRHNFTIPIDEQGAEIVVFISSRELKFNPRSILALAYLMNISKARWTIPSYGFEEANFSAMLGEVSGQEQISAQKLQTLKNLGARSMLLDSCLHAFKGPGFGPLPLRIVDTPYEITSSPLLIRDLMVKGRLKPRPRPKEWPLVVISDPCNAHMGANTYGAVRDILSMAGIRHVTLGHPPPNNVCCGGGGGAGLLPLDVREELTCLKREQLATLDPGSIVIGYCTQCSEVLREIIQMNGLELEFLGLNELLLEMLVPPR